jgi:hypothetical membrane protein
MFSTAAHGKGHQSMLTRTTGTRSQTPGSRQRVTRRLLACGAIGAPTFLVVLLIEGVTRPGYDPMRQLGSTLSLGEYGWIQVINFLVTGSLMLAFAAGLRRALHPGRGSRLVPVLIGMFGLGLISSGVFVTDPSDGYPPGTPPGRNTHVSWHGALHNAAAVVVFGSLTIACFALAVRSAARRGQRVWAAYCAATGIALPVLLQNTGIDGMGGLFQRVTIGVGWGWITFLALRLRSQVEQQPTVLAETRP